MSLSESRKRASAKWDAENMTTLGCRVKRTQAAAFKSYCEGRGQTSNTALKNFVLGCIGEQESSQEAVEAHTALPGAGAVSLPSDTIKAAREAAEAAGEELPVFVTRAVETQAQRDSITRKMKKAPDKKSEA